MKKKLRVTTETLRYLTSYHLGLIVGGLPISGQIGCISYDVLCETYGCSTGMVCTNSGGPTCGPG
jgi:hypothetical protein